MSLRRFFYFLGALFIVSSASLLSPSLWAAQPKAPDTIAERIKACAACHGTQGEGSDNDYFPRLAGKPTGYLYNQLKNFRDGHRKYAPMNYLVTYLSDDYLYKMAEYFSQQHPPYPEPEKLDVSAESLKRGEELALRGDASKNLPACIACHGKTLTGMQPAIPGLVGLHRDYISAQLGAWRSGIRHSASPDCMRMVAKRLNDEDILAVANWLAKRPANPNVPPAPAGWMKLPLSCGSVPR